MRKLLVVIQGDYVAPRFDLVTEVIIVKYEQNKVVEELKNIIMERPSGEALSQMMVDEHVTDLVCGGIEDLHYQFLVWKRVNVVDRVIAPWQAALDQHVQGRLQQGDVIRPTDKKRMSL
mgnify:CR=1 FL=1